MDSIKIDLRPKVINESFLRMFGATLEMILKIMFSPSKSRFPVKVKGNKNDLKAFANALSGEKKYIDAFIKHGLNDPRTLTNKTKLASAIKDFERSTGIKWPIK